jgi:hypothetical protein
MTGDSDGLVARIRNLGSALPTPDVVSRLRPTSGDEPALEPLEDLQARVAHLEQLVQGLQDSVYRESQRQDRRLSELEARLDPAALASALEQEARDRRL